MAYYSLEPWGEDRADLRSGQVAATVANAWLKKEDGKPWTPSDFMAFADKGEPEPEDELAMRRAQKMKNTILHLNQTLGGIDRRPQG